MFDTEQSQRQVGRFAWAMAWFGLVVGQLHALSRHNTVDGKEDLQMWTTRVWSDPARKALAPLLDWADPDTVYLTYGKIWVFVFAAFTACAIVVHRRRRPTGFEKWAWRVAIAGYALGTVSVVGDYYTQWTSYTTVAEWAFVGLTIPAFVVIMLATTVLGVTLLVKRFRPWPVALLLTLQVPLAVGVLMFTSMGERRAAGDVRLRHPRPPDRPRRHRRRHADRAFLGSIRMTHREVGNLSGHPVRQ